MHGEQAEGRKAAQEFGKFAGCGRRGLEVAGRGRDEAIGCLSFEKRADHLCRALEQINYLLSKVK